jgi:uncharacterized protein with FMN-binding domain
MAKMNKKWIALCSTALGAIYAAEYFVTEANASMQSTPQYSQVNAQTESIQTPSIPTPSLTPSPISSLTPSPTPSLTPSATPSLTPSATPSPTPSVTPSLTPSAKPSPSPTPSPTTRPTLRPTPSTTPSPTLSPTPKPTPNPTPSPTPSETPSPKPSPTLSLYKEGTFTGTGSNRRGSIQVTVTIKKDKITDVTISDFAMHYSERDVVGLPDEVLKNQSAQVDNVSGATYSTQAFQDAVQDALSQAQNT